MSGADAARPASGGVLGWLKSHVPTREGVERNRWLRPVAHRVLQPALWRFTRRSVPRGVALGVLAGVLFPVAHVPLAAVLALPVRANVPVAVSTTLLNNPVTIGPMLWAAYHLGHWVLRLDAAVPGRPIAAGVQGHGGVLHWIVAGGPPIVVGLLTIAAAGAVGGYLLAALAWRLRIARRWRNRRARNG